MPGPHQYFQEKGKEGRETLFKYLVVPALDRYLGTLKTELTINANQVKCWFLGIGETGVLGENLSVQRREPTN